MSKLTTLSQVVDITNAAINKVKNKNYGVGTYTIKKQAQAETGYSGTYQLFNVVGNVETAVGEKINIPKDMFVQSATVETVTTADVPYQGAVVGDKYIDMVLANSNNDHVYIAVNDLLTTYNAGNGIDISNSTIAVKIDSANANGLTSTASGLKVALATTSSAGAMSAADKAKIDSLAELYYVSLPTQSGTLTYSGSSKTPSWTGYDSTKMTIGGTTSATNAGDYKATFTPKSPYMWSDGTRTAKNATWSIGKATGTLTLSKSSVTTLKNASTTVTLTTNSDGTKSAESNATGKVTASVSGTTVTLTGGSTSGSATVTVSIAQSTNYTAVSKTISVNNIVASSMLGDNSPAVIQQVAQAGQASNLWSVGDKIGIAMSGTVGSLSISGTYYAFILGFDHNASIEGSNSIHFGLGMTSGGTKIAFVDSSYNSQISTNGFNMNTSNTNTGGWNGSQMRTNIMPAIKNALPSAWRSVIKATTKYSDNTGGGQNTSSYVTSTSDEIFLLAEWEVQGTRTYANSAEQNKQKQYDYFKNGNSKICYKHNDTSSVCNWWCRSVIVTNNSNFCSVAYNGAAISGFANSSRGVFSGFRVA